MKFTRFITIEAAAGIWADQVACLMIRRLNMKGELITEYIEYWPNAREARGYALAMQQANPEYKWLTGLVGVDLLNGANLTFPPQALDYIWPDKEYVLKILPDFVGVPV